MGDQSAVSVNHQTGLTGSQMGVGTEHVALHHVAAPANEWNSVIEQPDPRHPGVVRANVGRLAESARGAGIERVEAPGPVEGEADAAVGQTRREDVLVPRVDVDHPVGARTSGNHALSQTAAVHRRDSAQDGELVDHGAAVEPIPHRADSLSFGHGAALGAN